MYDIYKVTIYQMPKILFCSVLATENGFVDVIVMFLELFYNYYGVYKGTSSCLRDLKTC